MLSYFIVTFKGISPLDFTGKEMFPDEPGRAGLGGKRTVEP